MEPPPEEATREFLLKEFETSLDAYWRSEETGERRVEFFLTVATAVVAAFALGEGEVPRAGDVSGVFFVGSALIFAFGLFTLVRIVHRNLRSSDQLRSAARIRRYFLESDPAIRDYLLHPVDDERQLRRRDWRELVVIRSGGLTETVALVNALAGAGVAGLAAMRWAESASTPLHVAAAIVGFGATWFLQFALIKRRYEAAWKAARVHYPHRDVIRAAGAVLWRRSDGDVQVAVVHRSRHGGDWSFPKGKAERGEGVEAAAKREVREETGMTWAGGEEIRPPALYRVRSEDGEVEKEVRYWLAQPDEGEFRPTEEVDRLEWLSVPQARARLTYENDRRVLERAARMLTDQG